MKTTIYYFILLGFMLTNCSNDDNDVTNPLNNTNLLGEWKISSRGINNIATFDVCCESIIYSDDSNANDLSGTYIFNDVGGVITNGDFTIDLENNILLFTTENNNSYTQEYSLNSDLLEVWYFEDGNRIWTQYNKL